MKRPGRKGWDPFENDWGHGPRRRGHGRRRHGWPDGETPPEVAAQRFADVVEHVADKVGTALEKAFDEPRGGGEKEKIEQVGNRVADVIGQAIDKVQEAIPKQDPASKQRKRDKRLLRKRDSANNKMILFACLFLGLSGVVGANAGLDAVTPLIVFFFIFGGLFFRQLLWKRSNHLSIEAAEARLSEDETVSENESDISETKRAPAVQQLGQDSSPTPVLTEMTPKLRASENTVNDRLDAVESAALQIMDLLKEIGEERKDIRDSVEAVVAKNRELTDRRERLDKILQDPDLVQLDERIKDLRQRIKATEDLETKNIYSSTLEQLISQAESLEDVKIMKQRLEAYSNASLQSLRSIHIDLLRLQTGDLSDPAETMREITNKADNLSLETKSVREVVEEVQGARVAAGRTPVRQI